MASGAGESTLNEWETIVTPMLGESIRRLSLNSDLEIQMMEKRLISFSDLQTIRTEKTDSEKKLVLLHKYLYTREPGSLRRFIDALKKAGPGNESLADTLDQEYRKRQNPSVIAIDQHQLDAEGVQSNESREHIFIEVDRSLKDEYKLHEATIKESIRQYLENVYPGKIVELEELFPIELARRKGRYDQIRDRERIFALGVRPKMRIIFPNSDFPCFEVNREKITKHLCRIMQLKRSELEIDVSEGSITLTIHTIGQGLINILIYLYRNAEPLKFLLDMDELTKISLGEFAYVHVSVFSLKQTVRYSRSTQSNLLINQILSETDRLVFSKHSIESPLQSNLNQFSSSKMSFACPSSRVGHVAAVINGEMLMWGGAPTRGTMFSPPDLIECFNLSTSQWSQRRATSKSPSDLPKPCVEARIGVVQDRDIYQIGGCFNFKLSDAVHCYSNDVHKLDASTLEWERIVPSGQLTPTGRSTHGLCVLGKKGDEHLVLMGGQGPKLVSPIPEASQFIPHFLDPNVGWNNEVWLFSLQKRNWIPAQCTGKKPHPRFAHSFTTIDHNRALLIGGGCFGLVLNDAFLFVMSSLEWIEMKFENPLISRSFHSTVVVDTPTLGPKAFVLWGSGERHIPLSVAQRILIDFQTCNEVSISDEPIPTARQSVCSAVRRGFLFMLRFGELPFEDTSQALFDACKYDLNSARGVLLRHDLGEPIPPPEKVISVATAKSVLTFTQWKKFSSPVSLYTGAEIFIPNTRSTFRIQPRGGSSDTASSATPTTSIGVTVFTFDAKQSQGVHDDEFVSDLFQLSLPTAGSNNDGVEVEICYEHGLYLDPTTPTMSASKVVLFYQPHDSSAKTEHEIKFDEKVVIDSEGERKIAVLLQLTVVEIVVSPCAPTAAAAAAVASSDVDVHCSFFIHFYGVSKYVPSRQEIENLSFLMKSQWIVVARLVVPVFAESDINKIELVDKEEDQPGRFLHAWIRKYRRDATREALCAALFSAGLDSIATKVFSEIYKNMIEEALSHQSLQIKREDLVFDKDVDIIGEGAFGDVYKAKLKKDGEEKTVAVKVFVDIRRATDKELFMKEATVLFRIKPNPFILGLIGVCTIPRFYALVTEFVSGGDLASLLTSAEEAVEKWETRVMFARQIAQGMLHLHNNHPPVIHYDLKAQNVLVERILGKKEDQFICKVSDFGLSKMSGISAVTSMRQEGSFPAGTVTHIAPERYSNRPYGDGDDKKDLVRKSDVYSYGVLLWEIRERQHPYQGVDRDTIRFKVKSGEKLPEGQATNVPPFFDDLMKKCVQFDPKSRPMFGDILLTFEEQETN